MRPLAWILVVASLVAAIVAAVTAYSPKLAAADDRLVGLTLNAPAGEIGASDQPIADKDATLTPELIQRLRAAEEPRVRIKEFKPALWSEWWIFALGCAGMLVGALFIRRENARQLASVHADAGTGAGPDAVLAQIRSQVSELRARVAQTKPVEQREELILSILGRIIAEDTPAFIAARPGLVSRLGLAGYAQLMDRFAAAERQINRSWSAAADGYEEESLACLANAELLLEEAQRKMR